MPKHRGGSSRKIIIGGPGIGGASQPHLPPALRSIGEKTYNLRDIAQEKCKAASRVAELQQALSAEARRGLAEIRGEEPPESFESQVQDVLMGGGDNDDSADWEDEPGPTDTAPITHAIRDILQERVGYRRNRDNRTWRQRMHNLDANWRPLIPQLARAYLRWKYKPAATTGSASSPAMEPSAAPAAGVAPTPGAEQPVHSPATTRSSFTPATEPSSVPVAGAASTPAPEPSASPTAKPSSPPAERSDEYDFDIKVIDIMSKKEQARIQRSGDQTTAEALMLNGYLGSSPINPSFAISIESLEFLRCIRLFKASFSTEAFTKLACYLYYIPYRRYYRTAIADAFDIYLSILRDVRQQVMAELGRSAPNWRAVNSCPPCAYKLAEEEATVFDRMVCLDGNNSLKRLAPTAGRLTGDPRTFDSDYFLPRDFVAQFANEVKARQSQSKPDLPEQDHDAMDVDEPARPSHGDSTEGDPTDGVAADSSPCASNWKAAASEANKRMWGIFEETGVFACCCRHGIMLWLVDMVRSGELAKYALAIIAKILEIIGGKNVVGYDIGCTFEKTLLNSSLGPAFAASGSRFCVNAFHGYSHAYHCQVRYHPNCIEGIGLEDLETLERVFGDSNELAPVTRYATPYRRHVLIDMFFHQRDAEKYANLGLMIYNNYVQALEIIDEKIPSVEQAKKAFGISDAELRSFLAEESSYFTTWQDEDEANLHLVAYVEALQELRRTSDELHEVSRRFYDQAAGTSGTPLTFIMPRSGPTDYNTDLSATRKLETRHRTLRERVEQLTAEVNAMEVRLDIKPRWQPGDARYNEVVQYITERRYHRALGKLQRLVVQRLFELQKLNLARTGYKARTHIAKSLQSRCKAIRNAVNAYNQAARDLVPPREELDWAKVTHYAFLEEFALLRNTNKDVRDKQWVKPAVRLVMRDVQRIDRAREELINCNRDIRRLHTWIRDEEYLFTAVLEDLERRGDMLFGAAQDFIRHRRAANARNLAYIEQTYKLKGFTGTPAPGVRAGAPLPALIRPSHLQSLAQSESDAVTWEDRITPDLMDDDEAGGEVSAIMEYLADLTM